MRVTANPQSQAGPVSPQTLESWRQQGRSDDTIAEYMAQTNPSFAAQYGRIKQASGGDTRATTAFLNTRFYGDASYSPTAKEKKGFFGRIGDRIYQDIVDIEQAMEDQREGKQGTLNTIGQAAGNFMSIAGAVPGEVLSTGVGMVGKAVAGVDNALGGHAQGFLKQAGSDIANSPLGQDVLGMAQNVSQGYSNLRDQSPALRTAEAAVEGAAGLADIAGVAAIPQAATRTGQAAFAKTQQVAPYAKAAAQKVPLVNRIPGLRPDAVGTSTADDFARAAGVAGDDLAKPLSAQAQQFTKIGGDERLARFVDQSNPAEKGLMRSMLERQARAGDDLAATAQAKEVVGQHVMTQAGHLVKAKSEIGKRLGNVVQSIGGDTVDLTNSYTEFIDDLMAKGVHITSDGKLINMSALPDEDIAYIKDILKWMRPDKNGTVVRSAQDAHRYRQKLFAELNLAEIRQKPFSPELEKFVDEAVRNRLMRDITAVHPQYAPLAQAYAKTISPLRNFLKQIGYKGTVDDVTEAGFEGLRTGEVAMRTLGNASARPTQLLDELEQAAIQWGYKSPIRTQRLVKFADELENIFPVQQTRSLKGEVSRAVQDAVGVAAAPKAGLTRMAIDKVGDVVNQMRGMTPEARIQALRDLLNELPPSVADDIPGLTSAVDEFVNNAQADAVTKEISPSLSN